MPARHLELLRRFRGSRHGGVAVWAGLVAPVLIGFGALSVDVARLYNLDADLQTAADSLARAGAMELDRRSDSISRATAAIDNLVANEQDFADAGGGKVGVQGLRFLSGLPASDDDPITAAYVTTDATRARYVEVTVTPVRITTIFPINLVRGLVTSELAAQAVGGKSAGICGAAPLFICNPYEGTGQTLEVALEDRAVRGRLIRLRGKGGAATFGPGNFGFLEPPGGGGASDVRELFGQVSPATCFASEGVLLRTGAISSVDQALNVRFDIYNGSFSGKKSDPDYAPAQNVTKGYTYNGSNACNASPASDPDALSLPRDGCFATNSCPNMGGRMGDGNWDVVSYMRVNHRRPASADIAGVTYTFNYAAGTVSPSPKPTRYEVYRWEIETGRIPGEYTPSGSGAWTREKGAPRCYAGGAPPADPDRRVIPVAVLNCQALEAQYGMNGGSGPPLPVYGFAKVFLTEPMESGSDDVIWGEIVGMVQKGRDRQSSDQVEVRR